MREIKKLYRSTYTGEDVTSELTYLDGRWQAIRENIPNVITNNHISDKAIVIGNGWSRKGFDLSLIKNHKGGLLAAGALQSYGCNALYRDFAPHFLVANGPDFVKEIAATHYPSQHITYASASELQDHPGKFYLIPQDPAWNAGTTATYLACFDGHKQVYMLGFDGVDSANSGYCLYQGTNGYIDPTHGYNEEFMTKAMVKVFQTYNDVEFIRVMPTDTFRMPEAWKYMPNVRQITFHEMSLEVDL
jgi:hypothetical protein